MISTIQRHFSNSSSTPYRIVLYDLDGELSASPEILRELASVCHLELRVFNFGQVLPQELHERRSFAWKMLIIAEAFKELAADQDELLVYADSSVYFESSDFSGVYEKMSSSPDTGQLTPVQLGAWSRTSIGFATHPNTFNYLPADPLLLDEFMWEAGLMLFRRVEPTRQVLKWAVLCALTRDCIDPVGSNLTCGFEGEQPPGSCHRQDQSVMNILVGNMEADWWWRQQIQQGEGESRKESFHTRVLPFNQVGYPYMEGVRRFAIYRYQSDANVSIANCAGKKAEKRAETGVVYFRLE